MNVCSRRVNYLPCIWTILSKTDTILFFLLFKDYSPGILCYLKIVIFVFKRSRLAMMKSLTDKALLKAADEQFAFRILYDRYWEPLYIKALRKLHSEEDAQDVVQGIFISLWRNRQQIKVDDSLAPYLFTALKYAIIKVVYRKAQKGQLLPLSILDLEKYTTENSSAFEYKELKASIDTEVARLPDRMREIYRLSRVQHMRNAEIAEMLNISEQTVKNTLSVTLKRLKSKLLHFLIALLIALLP